VVVSAVARAHRRPSRPGSCPHVVLRLLAEQTDQPRAHIAQRHHPRGAAIGLGDRSGHVEHGAHRCFVAAVTLRLRDAEDPGLGQRRDALLDDPPIQFALGGVVREQWLEFAHPGDEFGGTGHDSVVLPEG
jgi:hypothetical protein